MPAAPLAPRVSVLMAAFNAERTLVEAVDSILKQTFADFEFIVVDDGSTDATGAILDTYQDARLRIIRQATNQGLVAALNSGLEQARGHYVARMDADDISLPERLRRQVEWLDRHPEVAVLATNAIRLDGAGCPIEVMSTPFRSPEVVGRRLAAGLCPLIHSSVMARRQILQSLGGYRAQFRHAEDFDLWLRVLQSSQVYVLPEVLHLYRSNTDGIRFTRVVEAVHSGRYAYDCYRRRTHGQPERLRGEFLAATNLTPVEAGRFWSLALEAMLVGDAGEAIDLCAEVIARSPRQRRARILRWALASPLSAHVVRGYRGYRRMRGGIGASPVGPFVRDFKHRKLLGSSRTHAD